MLPDLPGWDSLSTVTRYHNWAEMAGIVAVAVLVVAEVVSYQYGQRKDALTEQQQTATNQHHDEEMARLHLEATRLSAEAETAKNSIAQAQALTAQALLEQERLKRQMPKRALDAGIFVKSLEGSGKEPVEVMYLNGSNEARYLAMQISNAFISAKWDVSDAIPAPESKNPAFANQPSIVALGAYPNGITVITRAGMTPDAMAAAAIGRLPFLLKTPYTNVVRALGDALSVSGWTISGRIADPAIFDAPPEGSLRIVVGGRGDAVP